MHFHYFALRALAAELNALHGGNVIEAIFSQNRNELVLELSSGFLRVGCHTPLTYILPETQFGRARKNVVALFADAVGKRVRKVRAVPYERVLVMELEDDYVLYFKMHNTQANVLLRKGEEMIEMLNNSIEKDWEYREAAGKWNAAALTQSLVLSGEEAADKAAVMAAMRLVSPVFEKRFAEKIYTEMLHGNSFAAAFSALLQQVEEPRYWLRKDGESVALWLFEPPQAEGQHMEIRGIVAALQAFLRAYFQLEGYKITYKAARRDIGEPYQKVLRIYESCKKSISSLENERSPEELGHILMANLHAIQPNDTAIVCEDFYREGETITLKLNPDLSPQQNAALLYEKNKSRRTRMTVLREQQDALETQLLELAEVGEQFAQLLPPERLALTETGFEVSYLREVKRFVRTAAEPETHTSPFKEFSCEGWQIFVGKNAKNNDELTLHFARRDDTWLHARSVTGSHVVIRAQGNKPVPRSVLEYAASLAAFYSKSQNSSLVPVQYTLRRYVRKRKGDPAGAVVLEREEVLMVEPLRG